MNSRFLLGLLALFSISSVALAGGQKPGSLLVFPKYDNGAGSMTVLTVTNTHSSQSVRAHFLYINGESCTENNAVELLTPRDTVTLITAAHSPDTGRGYAYVYARGTTQAAPITFNHLAGTSIVFDALTQSVYTVPAVVFNGMTAEGSTTDLDSDGVRDMDGLEYSQAPDQTVIPRFFGQAGVGNISSELVLVNLTGGRAFTTSTRFLVFNDNEEAFSGEHTFYCWDSAPLISVSGATSHDFLRNSTNNDPGEVIGLPALEAGWILFDGGTANSTVVSISDPAVLVTLIEHGGVASAQLPFVVGEQDNGGLLPTSIFGN